jgi:uncharacterized membrane protein
MEKTDAPTKTEGKVEAIVLKVPDVKRPSMGMSLGLKSLNDPLKSLEKPLNKVETELGKNFQIKKPEAPAPVSPMIDFKSEFKLTSVNLPNLTQQSKNKDVPEVVPEIPLKDT